MLKRAIYAFLIATAGLFIVQVLGTKKNAFAHDELNCAFAIDQDDCGDSDFLPLWLHFSATPQPVIITRNVQLTAFFSAIKKVFWVKYPKYILYQCLLIG